MGDNSNFQAQLFELLKTKSNEKDALADILGEILNCSKDSVYRRMRGSTELSFDEAVTIARHFGIALSEVSGQANQSVLFNKGSFITDTDSYRDYMLGTITQLEEIKNHRNHRMYYQAKDIPVYYQFAFKNLAAFKIYVWMKSVYDIQQLEGKNYSMSMIPQDLLDLAYRQWELFSQINTVEIWNDTTILSMIKQLEYYYEAGLLSSKEEALAICDDFQAMMKLIYKQALSKRRVHANNHDEHTSAQYDMYYHEILIMDNHILAEIDENRSYYFIPYAGVNYLSTTDPALNAHMKKYLKEQTKKSSLISDVSEKERNKFFIRIKHRIDQLRQTIEKTDPFM